MKSIWIQAALVAPPPLKPPMPSKVLPKLVRSTASLSGKTAWNKSLTQRRCRYGIVRTPSNHQKALKKTSMSICLIQRSQIHQIRTVFFETKVLNYCELLDKTMLDKLLCQAQWSHKANPSDTPQHGWRAGNPIRWKKNGCKGGCWVRPSQKPQRFCKSQVSAASWNQGIFIYIYIHVYLCVIFHTLHSCFDKDKWLRNWMDANHTKSSKLWNSDHVSLRYPA